MRCTDCDCAKETIPEQLRYVFCTKYRIEVPVSAEFQDCYYEEEISAKAEGEEGISFPSPIRPSHWMRGYLDGRFESMKNIAGNHWSGGRTVQLPLSVDKWIKPYVKPDELTRLKELNREVKKKLNNILERVELSPPVESDLNAILDMLGDE